MVFGESVVDAVDAPAVAADVRDELFCTADGAPFQDSSLVWGLGPLKIVPPGSEARNAAYGGWVTLFLELFVARFVLMSGVPWAWALAIRPLRVLGWPCPTPLSSSSTLSVLKGC